MPAVSPPWDTLRPYLTGTFLHEDPPFEPLDISALPDATQRNQEVDHALNMLLGVHPAVISSGEHNSKNKGLGLDQSNPDSSRLLSRILPLAKGHLAVKSFIEKSRLPDHGNGYIIQSIGVAMSTLVANYNTFILQLDELLQQKELSAQMLLYYVQPSARSMELLTSVAREIKDKRGGAAFDAVYKLAMSHVGEESSRHVFEYILSHAALPMFDSLHIWLQTGVVHDDYDEFFIVHNSQIPSRTSWQMRFTINRDNLPSFLQPLVEKILRTGKYLHVLKECEVDTDKALADAHGSLTKSYPLEDLRIIAGSLLAPDTPQKTRAIVERAYSLSSAALMAYLNKTVRIKERLNCLRRFFLLQRSDFIVHFFDTAAAELSKPRDDVSRSKLSSLLDLSIRTSASASDPFLDDISCILCQEDLASQICMVSNKRAGVSRTESEMRRKGATSGYELFALDYRIQWPVSLIITETDMLKYQFMFRYLFYCKHVERELEGCWQNHSLHQGPLRHMPSSFVRSFALRDRMLTFWRSLLYYTVADVLEPNWRTLQKAISGSETIDEIMHYHNIFLVGSVDESLLSNEKHVKVFKNIAETCITFARYTDTFGSVFGSKEPLETLEDKLRARDYPATLAKFETTFEMHLGKLLDGLSAVSKKKANTHLVNLCGRFDAGGYYDRFNERSLASFGM